jgi:starch phosphorylase
MSSPLHIRNPVWSLLSTDIEGLDALAELALDVRWSWNHATDEVWRQLDPALWDLTHNPWGVLQTVSRGQVERVLGDPAMRAGIDDLVQSRRIAAAAPAWFQRTRPMSPLLSL